VQLTTSGFIVSDTGPGVDSLYEDSLFEIFVTAEPDRDTGQGLGLFIVGELLRADGCDIALLADRNEDGRRFRFAVDLRPLAVR
jgi:signal transduction histidine kinase